MRPAPSLAFASLLALYPLSSLALSTPLEPRGVVNNTIDFVQQGSIQRSDDEWICDPLQFSVSFLRAPATITAISPSDQDGSFTVLETVVEDLGFPITLNYTVAFPVGQKFAFRLEDVNGAAAVSPVLEVKKAERHFFDLHSPCRKRDPTWYERNWDTVDLLVVLSPLLLVMFFCAGVAFTFLLVVFVSCLLEALKGICKVFLYLYDRLPALPSFPSLTRTSPGPPLQQRLQRYLEARPLLHDEAAKMDSEATKLDDCVGSDGKR
ncbi:hypothetical protein JCM10207_008327 [Rhodosporidiobolus poonsookiae]